jgi:hypothetical protein
MQFKKLLSSSNALNGVKRQASGYNLMTGMLPNFGKSAAAPAATPGTSISPVSTILDSVFARLKTMAAGAKRVLLKPEEPFAAQEKKSYQVFRRLSAHDEVRHVAATKSSSKSTADALLTDNQELGKKIKPTLWEKLSFKKNRTVEQPFAAVDADAAKPVLEAHGSERLTFSATCPGKLEANPIADAFEMRMAEKKTAEPVVAKVAAPVLHSAARPEVKQSVPTKLREAIFGPRKKAAQPAVQGEFALENVRPLRNDLSDADLEVVSSVTKVGKGNLQTVTDEQAQSTATSRRAPKTDSAINSVADAPATEPTSELVARV